VRFASAALRCSCRPPSPHPLHPSAHCLPHHPRNPRTPLRSGLLPRPHRLGAQLFLPRPQLTPNHKQVLCCSGPILCEDGADKRPAPAPATLGSPELAQTQTLWCFSITLAGVKLPAWLADRRITSRGVHYERTMEKNGKANWLTGNSFWVMPCKLGIQRCIFDATFGSPGPERCSSWLRPDRPLPKCRLASGSGAAHLTHPTCSRFLRRRCPRLDDLPSFMRSWNSPKKTWRNFAATPPSRRMKCAMFSTRPRRPRLPSRQGPRPRPLKPSNILATQTA